MSIRETVGSLIESHCAKGSHPDRTAFLPQTAAAAYEHILTIQSAAGLEFPATDPANAPVRAEFKLGIFPPDHHAPPAAPTPAQTTPPAK
jgi:hypothetical protein